jgi:hypothetical protein
MEELCAVISLVLLLFLGFMLGVSACDDEYTIGKNVKNQVIKCEEDISRNLECGYYIVTDMLGDKNDRLVELPNGMR